MTRVILHVGAPKTGTTYLQEILFRNRSRLAEKGVLYPGDSRSAHYDAALDLRQLDFGGYDDPAADGAWETLAAQVRRWHGGTVVVSHELLGGARPEGIERAVGSFGVHEVHVLMTARDLGRQVPAVWQEMVKNNQATSYDTYLERVQRRGGRAGRIFWRQQDVANVLANWSEHVPVTQVHLITVPPAGSSSSLLWSRYASVLGVDPTDFETEVPNTNASLGLAEAELLRRVNMALGDRLEWPEFARTVKFGFAEQVLAARRGSDRAGVPDRLRPWLDEVSAGMVSEVRRRGYDVVGDLADLTPTYGDSGAQDRPSAEQVADTAAQALAELLVERARTRPTGAQRMVQDVSERIRGANRRRVLRALPEPVKAQLRRAARR